MEELLAKSVTELARTIRCGEISAVDVVQCHLDRIDAVNPAINAVVTLARDPALERAQRCDDALSRGEVFGPLHGVPMTIKDAFETAGVVTSAGTKGLAGYIPEQDATVVQRLRAAGAILLGKTNTPEITLRFSTDNAVHGRTNNPYDLERIPAGSSGGAAAIVAAGGSPFDIGSDTGGSIRLPAHCCGVAGIKPTAGRVSRAGHIPFLEFGATEAFTQVGPIARAVKDLTLLLSIIAGPDGRDPSLVPMPLGDPHGVNLAGLRVAFYTEIGLRTPTAETVDIVRALAAALTRRGSHVEEACPPQMELSRDLWRDLMVSDGGAAVRQFLQSVGTTEMHPFLDWTQDGEDVPSSAYVRLLAAWNAYRVENLRYLDRYDVVVAPVAPAPAPKHDEPTPFNYTFAYNLLGWPVVVVRCGTSSDGLPVGVQVVSRPWREEVALAVAEQLEIEFGGWQPPPLQPLFRGAGQERS